MTTSEIQSRSDSTVWWFAASGSDEYSERHGKKSDDAWDAPSRRRISHAFEGDEYPISLQKFMRTTTPTYAPSAFGEDARVTSDVEGVCDDGDDIDAGWK
jgi:hypothetical protein